MTVPITSKSVNEVYNEENISVLRQSVNKSIPYGSEEWVKDMVEKFDLICTTRNPGRPKKYNTKYCK